MESVNPAPLFPLYPYQVKWVEDKSRFKAGMWARQVGKSLGTAAEIVIDCRTERARWTCISGSQRQVLELFEHIEAHTKITGQAIKKTEETYGYITPLGERDEYKVLGTHFRNGSRIIGLPSNPDTVRGYSSNLYLDELSVHKRGRELWAAAFPIISRGGFRLIVTFTPKGKQNVAYDVWNNPIFSKHRVDIYEAVAQGCPHNIEELRKGINDPDIWAQEYELQFLDEITAFLTYDMINECEHTDAGRPELYAGGQIYVGMDIARRGDLAVIDVEELVGDCFWERERVEMHRESFRAQDEELDRIYRQYHPLRICMDQTGMGEKPVEDAKRRYGEYAVEGLIFSAPVKLDLANGIRRRFEDRQVRIPNDPALRDDLHSVKKITTPAGNIRFDAERDEQHGHADRFWAKALAIHAGSVPVGVIEYQSTGVERATGGYAMDRFLRP
jgi:phage FluMu gp28-like protein